MDNSSYSVKLEMAREDIQRFELESAAWIASLPYEIIDEPDPDPPPEPLRYGVQARRFRIVRADPIPGRLSALIGASLFQLRSALDQLTFALAKAHTPNMSAAEIQTSEFPVFADASGYANQKKRKIGCVAPAVRTAIEALQPYHRGQDFGLHPLWVMHDLNRIEKHREPFMFVPESMIEGRRSIAITWSDQQNFDWMPYRVVIGGEMKVGAILFRWAGLPVDPDRAMSLKPKAAVEILFGQSGPVAGHPVVPVLKSLCDFVGSSVIAPLSKFL